MGISVRGCMCLGAGMNVCPYYGDGIYLDDMYSSHPRSEKAMGEWTGYILARLFRRVGVSSTVELEVVRRTREPLGRVECASARRRYGEKLPRSRMRKGGYVRKMPERDSDGGRKRREAVVGMPHGGEAGWSPGGWSEGERPPGFGDVCFRNWVYFTLDKSR